MTLAAVRGIAAVSASEDGTSQPLDSDLTAIAALSTTAFGRSVLATANAAALATLAGVGTADTPTHVGLVLSADINLSGAATTHRIGPNTADAADSSRTFISGGGALSTDRGAYVGACGNEFGSSVSGWVQIATGNASGARIHLNGPLLSTGRVCSTGYDKQVPIAGFSITVGDNIKDLILDPAGTLASGTVTMPATPFDGQEVTVSSTQIVTSLTVSANAGQSIKNAPTTIAAGGQFTYKYVESNTTWYRVG